MAWTEDSSSPETVVMAAANDPFETTMVSLLRNEKAHVIFERTDAGVSDWTIAVYGTHDGSVWTDIPILGPFRNLATVSIIDFVVADLMAYRCVVDSPADAEVVEGDLHTFKDGGNP